MPDYSVRISGDPWNPRVEIDGHDISAAVRSVTVRYERNHRAEVSIELLADTVEIADLASEETKAVLSMPSDVEDALTTFGWTPPNMCAGGCR
jgi:Pyruvate/2-oxoacid:ferredoxin oxidoreductase gamma subunit